MLRVAVRLPTLADNVGEYLADVTALEAAAADTIWVDDAALDPWVVLGAIAALTRRARLGCLLTSMSQWPAARLGRCAATLAKVSRGRAVVGLPHGKRNHVAALREAGAKVFTAGSHDLSADGAIFEVESPDQLNAPSGTHIEVWAAIPIPPDREAWTRAINAYAEAGATGILVPWDARLIDLLRSAGEPDDRTDLLIAAG
jgi:alkanesulfonate monooxygenase SsuD/methylene tetrahydromethanopterin reductase-like flavin-dependent oxidoreductase (luciferase family)